MPPATDVTRCALREVRGRQAHGPDPAVVRERCLELYQRYIVVIGEVSHKAGVCGNAFDRGTLFVFSYDVQVMFTCEKTGVMTLQCSWTALLVY